MICLQSSQTKVFPEASKQLDVFLQPPRWASQSLQGIPVQNSRVELVGLNLSFPSPLAKLG